MWLYDLDLRSIRLTVVKVVVSSKETCNNQRWALPQIGPQMR